VRRTRPVSSGGPTEWRRVVDVSECGSLRRGGAPVRPSRRRPGGGA
jgi:hypothetical protein